MKPGSFLAGIASLCALVALFMHFFGWASWNTVMLLLMLSTWVYVGDIWWAMTHGVFVLRAAQSEADSESEAGPKEKDPT